MLAVRLVEEHTVGLHVTTADFALGHSVETVFNSGHRRHLVEDSGVLLSLIVAVHVADVAVDSVHVRSESKRHILAILSQVLIRSLHQNL